MARQILRSVLGRALGLDVDDNLVLGGKKVYYGHDTNTDGVVDLSTIGAAGDPTAATYAAARLLVGTAGSRLQVLGRTAQSDGGQGLFTWVAGGTTTVDEGYVLQATGGTWQRVDPSPTTGETLLNASWFNIKPANADTVNDTGFAKLKAQMQTSGTTTWKVFFPPGAYTYTNNRWLFGVQKVIFDAYDCTFQCTNANGAYVDSIPLFARDFFDDSGDVAGTGTVYANGYLFNTASPGAASITTTTAGDAGNFSAGMRVVLHGYDQQGSGYPPSLRYFEYKTVLTAVAGTGVVTFTDPVRNFYDSRWWDTANYAGTGKAYGAPRILSLERANYKQAKYISIKGAGLLANSVNAALSEIQIPADLLVFEDVSGTGFNTVQSDTHIIRRSKFIANAGVGDTSGGDKLVDRLIIEDCLLDSSSGTNTAALNDSVGVNSLSLVRCTLRGNIANIGPRSMSLNDVDIVPAASSFAGIGTAIGNPIRAVTIQNTRVYNTGGTNYGFTNQASPGLSLTVGSVVGTDIRIAFDATGKTVAYSLEYGMTLTNTVTGNTGIITSIYWETGSPGTLRIAGTWSAPTAADVFHYYDVMQITDGGANVIVGTQVPFWRGPPGPSLRTGTTLVSPSISGQINFPSSTGGAIQDSTTGLMFLQNSTNVFYLAAGQLNMQAPFIPLVIRASNNNLLYSNVAPTISSGFGTGASVTQNSGTASFSINVGTGGAASSGVIGLPTAAHGWSCHVADVTNPTANNTVQTGSSTTSVTVTNYVRTTGVAGAWPASDILQVSCWAN